MTGTEKHIQDLLKGHLTPAGTHAAIAALREVEGLRMRSLQIGVNNADLTAQLTDAHRMLKESAEDLHDFCVEVDQLKADLKRVTAERDKTLDIAKQHYSRAVKAESALRAREAERDELKADLERALRDTERAFAERDALREENANAQTSLAADADSRSELAKALRACEGRLAAAEKLRDENAGDWLHEKVKAARLEQAARDAIGELRNDKRSAGQAVAYAIGALERAMSPEPAPAAPNKRTTLYGTQICAVCYELNGECSECAARRAAPKECPQCSPRPNRWCEPEDCGLCDGTEKAAPDPDAAERERCSEQTLRVVKRTWELYHPVFDLLLRERAAVRAEMQAMLKAASEAQQASTLRAAEAATLAERERCLAIVGVKRSAIYTLIESGEKS